MLLGLRKTLLCKCGCRGWCTLYNVFAYIEHGLKALRTGERLALRHDGDALSDSAAQLRLAHPRFPFKAVLCQVKVDWGELAPTLGIPNWSSYHAPCPVCLTPLCNMFSGYEAASLRSLPWPEPGEDAYEQSCNNCEIFVTFRTVFQVRRVLQQGGLTYMSGDRGRGLTVARDVPSLHLLAGDRLEPSVICRT